ncbi:hypothetical protein [Ralstonia insidiosa]|jgi:hypothetical protein|nr:hypothetical protein [Ralstonia insidiosa]MBA9939831.1 hypothetical protein [Ralstonia insidiosa]MBC9968497.1 hypothetical protein [Ralstonia insidiosa]MBX3904682.1 hypothetical protein [Ralstonia insidiosa]
MPEAICESAPQPAASAVAPVDPAAIVAAVNTANDRLGAAVIFNLLLDERDVSGRSLDHIKRALGEGADELIRDYQEARAALTSKLKERVRAGRDAAGAQLNAMLSAAGLSISGEPQLLATRRGGLIQARVVSVSSARLQEDGSIWGFLRLETSRNSYEEKEFTFSEGKLVVRDEPDLV